MAGEKLFSPTMQYYFTKLCNAFSNFTLAVLPFFLLDLLIPITVDSKPSWNTLSLVPSSPLANNLILMAIFFTQHSSMARQFLKRIILSVFPDGMEKAFYTLASAVCMVLLYLFWLPMTDFELWSISHPVLYCVIIGCNFAVCGLVVKTVFVMKEADINGTETAERRMRGIDSGKEKQPPKLVKKGLYCFVRHPLMSLQMLLHFISPVMTVGHAIWSCCIAAYVVIAVMFLEEPALIEEFGEEYKQYMKEVPRFVPSLRKMLSRSKSKE